MRQRLPTRHLKLAAMWLALASLPLRATVLYVDGPNPQAADSNPGSATAPLKTIAGAMLKVRPGDVLTIRAGTYREPILLPPALLNQTASLPTTTIQGDPTGKTVIKGSRTVSGWKPLPHGVFSALWPEEPEQVFIDGKPLAQIGGTVFSGYPVLSSHPLAGLHASRGGIWPGRVPGDADSLPMNGFYYDATRRLLFVRSALGSLAGHLVEVSSQPYLLFGRNANNLHLLSLTFSHANSTYAGRAGALLLTGTNLHLANLTVSQTDGIGLELEGNDLTLRDSRFNDNGQLGLKARGRNLLIENVETSGNNTRGFNKDWEAGGAKFVGSGGLSGSVVSRHQAYFNRGDGLWFEFKNRNNVIRDSAAIGNRGIGIHYAASSGATITNNVVAQNALHGIYLPHSAENVITHNLVAHNGQQGVAIDDDGRQDPTGELSLRPVDNKLSANLILANAGAIALPDVIVSTDSVENVFGGTPQQSTFASGNGPRLALPDWQARTGLERGSVELPAQPLAPPPASATTAGPDVLKAYLDLAARLRSTLPVLKGGYVELPAASMPSTNPKAGPAF